MDRTQNEMTGAPGPGPGTPGGPAAGGEYCPPRAGVYRDAESGEIKSDINRTRAEMDHTIDELSERLRPRRLLDQALGRFAGAGGMAAACMPDRQEAARMAGRVAKRAASRAGRTLGHQIKEHPIPAMLAGAALCYLLYEQFSSSSSSRNRWYAGARSQPGRVIISECDVPDYYGGEAEARVYGSAGGSMGSSGPGMRDRAESAYYSARHKAAEAGRSMRDRVSGMGETLRHKASGAAESMRHRMSETGEQMRHQTSRIGEAASEQAGYVKEKMQYAAARAQEGMRSSYEYGRRQVARTANEYPISMGLACMAAGLVAGLSLPHTRTEDRWIGEQSDELKEYAREAGEELMDRGKAVARAAADAAADTAREEGLTPSQLKERVRTAAQQTKEQVKHAAQETKEKVKHVAQESKEAAKDAAKGGDSKADKNHNGPEVVVKKNEPKNQPGKKI